MSRIILGITAAAILVAAPVAAQERPETLSEQAPILQALPDVTTALPPEITEFLPRQASGQLLGSDLVGWQLYGTEAGAIGTIEDVLLDESGKLAFAVVTVAGTGSAGKAKEVAIPFDTLGYRQDDDGIRLVAGISRAELEAAPDFVSLADEMSLHDTQSMTVDETKPQPAQDNAPPRN